MKPSIIFMGTPDFAVPSLLRLIEDGYPVLAVVCQPDKPVGRHQVLTPPPVKQTALEHGLPVLQPVKIRTGEFAAQLRALDPDLIVTAAYGRILPPDILAIPRLGCLNVHGSLLPEYRGAAPVQWSIIDGRAQTGITIMMMDEGMDTGDILLQSVIDIPQTMDAGQLMDTLARLGADKLPEALEGFVSGHLKPVPQDHSQATYAAMVSRETGRIDWNRPAQAIHDLVRGTYPWPGAWTEMPDGKRLKIHRTSVTTDPVLLELAINMTPGSVISARPAGITVATAQGAVDLLDIQPEGGKRLSSADCAHNYKQGMQFGGRL